MTLIEFSKKYRCQEREVHAAVVSLLLKAIRTQNDILIYHFREDEIKEFISRRYPCRTIKLRVIRDGD